MLLHVSDHIRGRVDEVPGCSYVATEFVCAWYLPVLPRRSLLFFADPDAVGGLATVPVRLSLKSILSAYARPFFIFLAGVMAALPLQMLVDSRVKADVLIPFLLHSGALLAVPCLVLFAMRRGSMASPRRRSRLAEVEGLPPAVVMMLREGLEDSIDVSCDAQ